MNAQIRGLTRETLLQPKVQVSLDLTSNADALATARTAVEAGADWIEVGTPLILAEGLHAVRLLRAEFPEHPIVVDLKTMDGGYLEAQMMAEAGANAVVVMGQAHEATIEKVCQAGEDFGLLVMGDDLGAGDYASEAARLESLGVGLIVHHIGFDQRSKVSGLSPLSDLDAVVRSTSLPVQAVGGLSIEQAISCPGMGAPIVVFGAPLVIDGEEFKAADVDLLRILTEACDRVHASTISYPH